MKRRRVNPVSAKRKLANEERAVVVAQLRARYPFCQARVVRACTDQPQDPHEVFTRGRGGSITDPDNILIVCRPCHTWITEHPIDAACWGFVVPSWVGAAGLPQAKVLRELFRTGRGKDVHPDWCAHLKNEPGATI